jgi:TolB-like protein/class 3 adenylate cyclase/tetratricopeptide (TPR) repeat protein
MMSAAGEAMKQPVERRLAAILAADVAGYSRLMGADEEGTLARLKAHRSQLIDPKIADHRGRIVKTTGDGMLAEFASVVDAVRCAVEVQRGIADRNAEIPEDKRIAFRIGINLGDVIIDADDIYGDGVNIAARLEALAEPGGICIARVVRDQIRDKLPYSFEDMGEQTVKNIARPVRAYAMGANAVGSTPVVAVAALPGASRRGASPQRLLIAARLVAAIATGTLIWLEWPKGNSPTVPVEAAATATPPAIASSPAPHLSFVVLPFANLSSDPEQEYFADGITDDLTTDLSRISDSFVIAHNTAFTYKGKSVDAKQVGRELGVRYVIEGSVRRSGNRVQVNVQLIDAGSGTHLWADRFDTDRTNLAEAQNEITGRLAGTLHLELVGAAGRRIEQEKTVDPDAQDLVMIGRALLYRRLSATTDREAERSFERALAIDPQSVDARIGVASALVGDVAGGFSSSVQQDVARAEQLLLEALDRDANRSDAHRALGLLRRFQNRLAESRIEWETAIALDRNDAGALRNLGLTLMYLGQPEAAIPQIEKGIRLSPRDYAIVVAYWGLGMSHLLLGHLDEGIGFLRKARAANSQFFYIHFALAAAFGLKGDLDEAKAALAEGIKLRPEVNSLAAWRAHRPWETNPQFTALADKTVYAGLRRAGFPEE